MDQQNIFFFGCVTLALAISAFILWGPSHPPRKKKGHIVGLVNLGSTCFLNTLLQALASCAIFLHWLSQQRSHECSLTSSLLEVLWVLNGDGTDIVYAPVKVLSALKRHGWMVPSGEQDAHELFLIIISTLQEEQRNFIKACSLSDALVASENFHAPSHAFYSTSGRHSEIISTSSDFHMDSGPSTAEKHTRLISNPLGQGDIAVINNVEDDNLLNCRPTVHSISDTSDEVYPVDGNSIRTTEEDSGEKYNENLKTLHNNLTCKSAMVWGCYNRATGDSVPLPQLDALPFQGLLTSTLQCSACGHYSYVHYDTFDSLSLPLGDTFNFQGLKLQDLLMKFVKPEIIPDVECQKCCNNTTAFKTMNFGKLPACLCLHIARANWQSYSSTPTKRDDFVDFPEYLPMDEYTISARLKRTEPVGIVQTINSGSLFVKAKTYKHIYKLKSVVVHLGGVNSGHFLTYRRGALNRLGQHRTEKKEGIFKDSKRWYLTSDDNVKISTLHEAMESLAYILFYEKCVSNVLSTDECNTSNVTK